MTRLVSSSLVIVRRELRAGGLLLWSLLASVLFFDGDAEDEVEECRACDRREPECFCFEVGALHVVRKCVYPLWWNRGLRVDFEVLVLQVLPDGVERSGVGEVALCLLIEIAADPVEAAQGQVRVLRELGLERFLVVFLLVRGDVLSGLDVGCVVSLLVAVLGVFV